MNDAIEGQDETKNIRADGVKVRLQTQSHDGPRRNMGQMFVHIIKEHGAQGLYKGVSTIFLMAFCKRGMKDYGLTRHSCLLRYYDSLPTARPASVYTRS